MKSIKYALLVVLLVFNYSCKNDVLDVEPTDRYSAETFWKTEEQANAGLTGCYKVLHEAYGNATWFFETDMITPNGVAYNESNGTDAIARGVHNSITPLVSSRWNVAYAGIGRTNTFLDKIGSVPMNEGLKSRMTGEAKFLRAFYYFNLTDFYGDVPLILETPNAPAHADLPRTPKETVVEQIIKDLDEAIPALSAKYTGRDVGRVTKGAALALKSRVLLYNEKWPQAAQAAKEVMDLNSYSLFPNYREIFFLQNENNPEVVFDVQYLAPQFTHNYDHMINVLNRPAPLKDLVDAYLMQDGKSINDSPLYDPARPYDNRDPRLHQTIVTIGSSYNGKVIKPTDVVTTGFGLKKYTYYQDNVTIPILTQGNSEINPIVIRYAEVLLTYAEAQNEASGPDESVYAALNQIRKRPSVNMPEIEQGLTKEQMREIIRHERRIELAFEGLYYSDIRRWKIAEVVNNKPIHNYEGKVIVNRSFNKERDYLWPVPQVQIQENPNLAQNPNWN